MSQAWIHNLMPYLETFLISLALTAAATPLVRWIAIKTGVMDHPSPIKVHARSTPRLGGVAIYMGFVGSMLFYEWVTPRQQAVMIGASFALIIGVLDDIRPVPAVIKLAALFGITWFLSQYGVILKLTSFYWLDFFLTLFWIVGVTSAFNAMDNMDGMASGLTFFAALAYTYVAMQNHLWGWGILSVALMGSSLGFLFHNFPPASIFMGDSGSFFLGYSLAVMSVMGEWSTNPLKAIAVPIFILGLPIFDLIYVVVRRQRQKITRTLRQIITFSAKDHFSHRLFKLGMTHRQVLFFTYAAALALSMGAVAMRYVLKFEAILLCLQYLIVVVLITLLMEIQDKKIEKDQQPK